MGEELAILKLLPEGVSVVAVMVTLVIGIRYIKYLHADHKSDKQQLTESHQDQIKVILNAHKDERMRFQDVLLKTSSSNEELMDSHRTLMEEHLKTSGEMVVAVKGLESAVRELQQKVI